MGCDTYSVMIAKEMTIGNAVILVEALFNKWYEEKDLKIMIAKETEKE